MSRLERRLDKLEQEYPPDEAPCPRCSTGVIVIVNGKFASGKNPDGTDMTEEQYDQHESEWLKDGSCPVCGRVKGPAIKIGGSDFYQGKGRHGRPLRSV